MSQKVDKGKMRATKPRQANQTKTERKQIQKRKEKSKAKGNKGSQKAENVALESEQMLFYSKAKSPPSQVKPSVID